MIKNESREKARPTILVVDDEEMIRNYIKRVLESKGYHVLSAASVEEGLELYHGHHPNVVLTDILMTDRDGIEFIGQLKEIDSAAHIIAMSGGGRMGPDSPYLVTALMLGAEAAIHKPFAPGTLLRQISRMTA